MRGLRRRRWVFGAEPAAGYDGCADGSGGIAGETTVVMYSMDRIGGRLAFVGGWLSCRDTLFQRLGEVVWTFFGMGLSSYTALFPSRAGRLDVSKHIVLDTPLHGHGFAVLVLDACFATVAGEAAHFLAELFVLLRDGFGFLCGLLGGWLALFVTLGVGRGFGVGVGACETETASECGGCKAAACDG